MLRRLAPLLLLLIVCPLDAQDIPMFTSDFTPREFAARRTKVLDAIGPTGVAIVQGAPSPAAYVRFRQSNELYYLTGIEVPHAYVLLDGANRRTTLYLPHRNEARESREGKMLSAEDAGLVKSLSGVEFVLGTDALADRLARYTQTSPPRVIFTPFFPAEGGAMSRDLATRVIADYAADPWDGRPSREGAFVNLLHSRFPQFEVRDLTPTLDQLRLIKSPHEMDMIRKATRAASEGILEAMRSTVPGIHEYELDAVAKYFFYRDGAQGDAYFSLIASGPNAIYPHYNAGKRVMRDGELLLMDYAPDIGYYMSDVTRMWPVSGTWSGWQRELYGFYVDCYRAILNRIRPAVTAAVIREEAARDMDAILARSKFSKPIYETAARTFVANYHKPGNSLGHWVGMATHDDGNDPGPLREGMVFTIEPALVVPEEKIYIRLEDVIFIHDKSAEIVTASLPMDMPSIEKIMKDDGMLQKYPKQP